VNPETKFTNKVRKAWSITWPSMAIYKHSDRFNGGIADLHIVLAGGQTAWVEVKWVPSVAKKRKAGATDLQVAFLEEHAERGVPSIVLVGTKLGFATYRIEDYDGYVHAADLRDHIYLAEIIDEIFYGGVKRPHA